MSSNPKSLLPRMLGVAVLAIGSIGAGSALADDPPPADNPAHAHHHDAAWEACKKQADDQKLAPGDARREFMKTCMKSAKTSPPPSN